MIICDGSSLLHRVLNTEQAELQDSRGRYTGGVHGFLTSLGSLVKKRRYNDFIIVAFDLGVPLFRRKLFRNYKPHKSPIGNVADHYKSDLNLLSREGDEASSDFIQQYLMSRRLLHEYFLPKMGCMSVQIANCEADDIIAYACFHLDEKITILSTDRDLLQLTMRSIEFYDGRMQELWTVDDIIQKHNLVPERWRLHWLLAKAMTGDKSDGIPGVGGIGPDACVSYARQLVQLLDTMSLPEALNALERIPRGIQSAYENLKTSATADIITRNVNLIDLTYPYINKCSIVQEIKAGFAATELHAIDLDGVLSELHDMQMIKAKLYAQYICDSNEKFDATTYRRKLVL